MLYFSRQNTFKNHTCALVLHHFGHCLYHFCGHISSTLLQQHDPPVRRACKRHMAALKHVMMVPYIYILKIGPVKIDICNIINPSIHWFMNNRCPAIWILADLDKQYTNRCNCFKRDGSRQRRKERSKSTPDIFTLYICHTIREYVTDFILTLSLKNINLIPFIR